MKGLKQRLVVLCGMVLIGITATAYDFSAGGVYYNVTSASDLTCGVTSGEKPYECDIIIPDKVTYDNKTYTVTSIVRKAFAGCISLWTVKLPEGMVTIADSAFQGCTSLEGLVVPKSVTSIENCAFEDCTGFESLVLEDGAEILTMGFNHRAEEGTILAGENLFYDCPLKSVYLGRNLEYNSEFEYGNSPFHRCQKLTTVTISDIVNKIPKREFSGCTKLASIDIPATVTEIGRYAFYDCDSLKTVVIPNSVEGIGRLAFQDCDALESITIGTAVDTIGMYAFSMCLSLKKVISLKPTAPTAKREIFSSATYTNAKLYVPEGSKTSYGAADQWKNFTIEELGGVEGIEDDAAVEVARYSLEGLPLNEPQKGVNIVKMSDGSVRKVLEQ